MKRREEWGPADEFVDGVSKTTLLLLACLLLFALGSGIASAVMDRVAAYAGWEEINQRGFVGCVDGHVLIKNIDFAGLADDSLPILNLDNLKCAGKTDAAP